MVDNSYQIALSPDDPEWPKMVQTTPIPGLLIYERETFSDDRGFFKEVLELRDLERVLDKKITITQWNHSRSKPKVIRGFHAEPWEKIVYALKGDVLAVIVDFRPDSPAFGKAVAIEIGESNKRAIYLPQGMGNSYANIGTTDVEYMYLITNYFEGKPTPAVNYNDPVITKQFGGWPIENPIVSDKDRNYPMLKEKFEGQVNFSHYPWLNK